MKLKAVALSLLAAISVSSTGHTQARIGKLLGEWTMHECGPAKDVARPCESEGAYSLAFKDGGLVEVTTVFLNGLGKGQGEGFAAEGRYRLAGKRLIVTRPGRAWEAWPSRDGNPPSRYSCDIAFARDGQSFRLDHCVISGTWLRKASEL